MGRSAACGWKVVDMEMVMSPATWSWGEPSSEPGEERDVSSESYNPGAVSQFNEKVEGETIRTEA